MPQHDLRIALLIDGDNAQPSLIEPILKMLDNSGTCVIRRVYGDWTAQNMSSGWRTLEQKHGIQLVHQSSYVAGKNSTDIALTIAAMDILYSGKVNAFCIVSSDSDFTSLAVRLKDEGVSVIAAGKSSTPQAFVTACSFFIVTDKLNPAPKVVETTQPSATLSGSKPTSALSLVPKKTVTPAMQSKASAIPNKPAPVSILPVISKKVVVATTQPKPSVTPSSSFPNARPLLCKAYEASPNKDGWVFLGALGHSLRQIDPQFKTKNYGQKGLTQLVAQFRDLFDTRAENGKSGTQQTYIKLKKK